MGDADRALPAATTAAVTRRSRGILDARRIAGLNGRPALPVKGDARTVAIAANEVVTLQIASCSVFRERALHDAKIDERVILHDHERPLFEA